MADAQLPLPTFIRRHPTLWLTRLAWVTLPLTTGAVMEDALSDAATPSQLVCALGAWTLWALTLVGIFVRRPWGLTAARILGPVPLLIAIIAAFASNTSVPAIVHGVLVWGAIALAETGADIVDGLSYGDERRLPLKVPFGLFLGPVQVVWVSMVAGSAAGPLLLAARQWIPGAILSIIGLPLAWLGMRSFHQLSRRWIVFVPNGFVIHDLMATREPFLLRRQDVLSIGPADAEIDLTEEGLIDVSQNALGLVLEVRLDGDIEVVPRSRGVSQVRIADRILFSPARPGAALAEARNRRIPR
ncbi:MAG: hypothetical protein P8N02_20175 [Actinomycetota bacterium]|jgi:hypothetical protein|nr:hypothetical protein [Actinomycetota bacterium]